MAWEPRAQVIDLTQIADNLLGYVEAQQDDALAWAYGGPGLEGYAKFYSNAVGRLQTIFPSLLVLTQTIETDITGDLLLGGWQVMLESAISGADTDEIATNTKYYAKALESMLSNMPSTTLTADSEQALHATLFELETRFDITRQIPSMAWVQLFQTRCVYRLTTAAY